LPENGTGTLMAEKERLVWLDALRLAAGLSMVGLHSTADSSGLPWVDYSLAERTGPILLRAVLYTARTELFLMISVFLLLMSLDRRPATYRQTIAVQVRRLLVPFAFWTVFYVFYTLIKADYFGHLDARLADLTDPVALLGYATLGSVKFHMHFLPTLFLLVLMYPLFRVARKYPQFGMAVIVCLLVKRELDGFLYGTFYDAAWLEFAVRAVKVLTYAGYGFAAAAALGLWDRLRATDGREWFLPALYIGLALFTLKLVASYKTIESGAWPFNYTAGYWADFLMPVALFAGCMSLAHRRWPPILSRLAPYSFGIYLCHPIFLDLAEIALSNVALTPTLQVLIKIVWTLTTTSILVAIMGRIPLIAWTIGLGPLPRLGRRNTQTAEIT